MTGNDSLTVTTPTSTQTTVCVSSTCNSISTCTMTSNDSTPSSDIMTSSIIASPKQKEQLPLSPPRDLTKVKLDDLKVSDLRAELKKRNLPVSGPKPQLIERLKPHCELITIIKTPKTFTKCSASSVKTSSAGKEAVGIVTLESTTRSLQVATATNAVGINGCSPGSNRSLSSDDTDLTSLSSSMSSGGRLSIMPVSPDSSAMDVTMSPNQVLHYSGVMVNGTRMSPTSSQQSVGPAHPICPSPVMLGPLSVSSATLTGMMSPASYTGSIMSPVRVCTGSISIASPHSGSIPSVQSVNPPSVQSVSPPSVHSVSPLSVQSVNPPSVQSVNPPSVQGMNPPSVQSVSPPSIQNMNPPSIQSSTNIQSISTPNMQNMGLSSLTTVSMSSLQNTSLPNVETIALSSNQTLTSMQAVTTHPSTVAMGHVDSTTSTEKMDVGEETMSVKLENCVQKTQQQHHRSLNMKQVLMNEDLLRQQQTKIEELERELKKSQMALKQQQLVVLKQQQMGLQGSINPMDTKMLKNLQLKQHILNQQHQKLQTAVQKQQQALTSLTNATLEGAANRSIAMTTTPASSMGTITSTKKLLTSWPTGTTTKTSRPSALTTATASIGATTSTTSNSLINRVTKHRTMPMPVSQLQVALSAATVAINATSSSSQVMTSSSSDVSVGGLGTTLPPVSFIINLHKPPPDYDEATKQLKQHKQQPQQVSPLPGTLAQFNQTLQLQSDHHHQQQQQQQQEQQQQHQQQQQQQQEQQLQQEQQQQASLTSGPPSATATRMLPSLAAALSLPAVLSASTKSQAIDDVLEILIKNGELPESAAQEPPPTPKTTEAFISAANTVAHSFTPSALQQPLMPVTSVADTEGGASGDSSHHRNILSDFNLNLEFPVDEEYIDFNLLERHIANLQTSDIKQESNVEPMKVNAEVCSSHVGGTFDAVMGTDASLEQDREVTLQLVKSEFPFLDGCQGMAVDCNPTWIDTANYFTDNMVKNGPQIAPASCSSMIPICGTFTTNTFGSSCSNSPFTSVTVNMAAQGPEGHFTRKEVAAPATGPRKVDFHLEVSDISDAEPDADEHMDLCDWLDVIMPSTGTAPLSNNAPVTLGADVDAYMVNNTSPASTLHDEAAQMELTQTTLNADFAELLDFDDMDFTQQSTHDVGGWDKIDVTMT
ncbi:PREDICTED: dual specificity protein kinase splA-like [Priapulus caudatus]|uniref:Dual specificity protein kinase splA-like n=1 Tax=Priapulus caudatus TaxID=37621 RepID=A0ABM1DU24_PRICU|nr:PREDICTED: dual specificity protein kinase splA-like [Priapulus caudatus]